MKNYEQEFNKVLKKLTMDERKTIASIIGGECNYFIANYLQPKSNARIESIGEFTLYLQEVFDHLTPEQRACEALDSMFNSNKKSHLRRIK